MALHAEMESNRVMCDLPPVAGLISSGCDPGNGELLKSHRCPVTTVPLSETLNPGLLRESLPAVRAVNQRLREKITNGISLKTQLFRLDSKLD